MIDLFSERRFSNLCTFLVHPVGLAHLLFASFPPVSKKQEKFYTLPSAHDLAVVFWAAPVSIDILRFYLNQRTTSLAACQQVN